MRIWLLALIVGIPAFANWTRTVSSGKGNHEDKPQPETLQYFIQFPSLHDASGDFCYLCTEDQRLAAAKKEKGRADVSFLGRVNGREIYDILYYFDDEEEPRWKSLIVERGLNRYGEILQIHPGTGGQRVRHSELDKVGKEQLVHAIDNCERLGCIESFYRIGPDGPVRVPAPTLSK